MNEEHEPLLSAARLVCLAARTFWGAWTAMLLWIVVRSLVIGW